MQYRKIETTVHYNGTVGKVELGTVSVDRFDADKQWERERASNIAKSTGGIETIEETDTNIVTIYTSGRVKILAYILEDK